MTHPYPPSGGASGSTTGTAFFSGSVVEGDPVVIGEPSSLDEMWTGTGDATGEVMLESIFGEKGEGDFR